MTEEKQYAMRKVLAEEELSLEAKFSERSSVLPMYNLVQYYMNNHPNERMKILFWSRVLLQLAQ